MRNLFWKRILGRATWAKTGLWSDPTIVSNGGSAEIRLHRCQNPFPSCSLPKCPMLMSEARLEH
eukprot:3872753-Prorocentrum_lima.AAC.1